MKVYDYISLEELEKSILKGHVSAEHHPEYNNLIKYNYTQLCQDEKGWNDTVNKCRGLIVDLVTNEIIAKPFIKFFNFEEYNNSSDMFDCSNIPFNSNNIKIYEKLDGSLGILYWINGIPYITTKGSFISNQGKHATKILHTKYKDVIQKLNPDITYLFEIIYPEDLHCITYKGVDDIFLIGMINTDTGENIPIENCDLEFSQPQIYKSIDWQNIRNIISPEDKEGFVVLFDNHFRLKLKYDEYLKLQSINSGLSRRKIIEYYIEGREQEIKDLLKPLDEEHKLYYYKTIFKDLEELYAKIIDQAIKDLDGLVFENKKEASKYILTCEYPHVMFAIYNGKNPSKVIWKLIKNIYKERNHESNTFSII